MQIDFGPDLIRTDAYDIRVDQFRAYLFGRGWVTARQLKTFFGWSDRTCRALAEVAAGHILSGQQGYKLTIQATPLEMAASDTQWTAQIRRMITRRAHTRRI